MSVALDWYAEGSPQAKICDLECHGLVIHQQVLGLEVTVHDTMLVTMSQAFDQLIQHALQKQATQKTCVQLLLTM